jgi:hypothetical protein
MKEITNEMTNLLFEYAQFCNSQLNEIEGYFNFS